MSKCRYLQPPRDDLFLAQAAVNVARHKQAKSKKELRKFLNEAIQITDAEFDRVVVLLGGISLPTD